VMIDFLLEAGEVLDMALHWRALRLLETVESCICLRPLEI